MACTCNSLTSCWRPRAYPSPQQLNDLTHFATHARRYPYFAGVNQRSIDINFVLGANGISQQGCMLVSMVDGARIALQKIGYPNLPIVIGETGMVPMGENLLQWVL